MSEQGRQGEVRSSTLSLALLLALSLALRVGYVLAYPQMPVVKDAAVFQAIAANVAEGRGYTQVGWNSGDQPDSSDWGAAEYWSPGYPLLLALVFRLFGPHLTVVRLLHAVIGAATVLVIAGIAKRLFGRRVALIAGVLASIYPPFIFYTGILLTETVYTFLLAASVYLLLRRPLNWRAAAAAGVLLGIGALMRSDTLALPFVMLAVMAIAVWKEPVVPAYPSSKPAALVTSGSALLIAMFAVVAPWSARNYTAYGRFIPIDAHSGHALWISTYPEDWLEWRPFPPSVQAKLAGLDSVQQSIVLRREALRNLEAFPGAYASMSVRRFARFWVGSHTGVLAGFSESFVQAFSAPHVAVFFVKAVMIVVNSAFIAAGLAGLWRLLRSGVDPVAKAILLSPILFKTALHTFMFSTSRYQISIMPLMIVLAAYSASDWKVLSFARRRS